MPYNEKKEFKPATLLRSSLLQTYLASSKARARSCTKIQELRQEIFLPAGKDTILQGYEILQSVLPSMGIIILLHGWEGSTQSSYIQSAADFFYTNGFDIFTFNFRDHGNSHSLNKGLFHASRLDEVQKAVNFVCKRHKNKPVFLIGFSLGGSFALRVALSYRQRKRKPLQHVFAVCPVMDPDKTTDKIDRMGVIRKHFVKKWISSLKKKQQIFPDVYNFKDVYSMRSCREITEELIPRYTGFSSAQEYFKSYTITKNDIHQLDIPTSIFMSRDDPVIPIDDFLQLRNKKFLNLDIQEYGGHCGFIKDLSFNCWYHDKMYQTMINSIHNTQKH